MGQRPGQKIKLTSVDELLCVPQTAGTEELDVYAIYSFENHPFKVVDDEKMDELVESIKENGVLTPIVVRPDDEGTYEMISGHRRLHAAIRAGLSRIPAIVKKMTNDEAIIMMVDANIQREEILPSEKAFAFKMKLDAIKRQGARSDLTSGQFGPKSMEESRELVAEQFNVSCRQVTRFVHLTNLIPELLDYVDTGRIPVMTGVEMSYFGKIAQHWLYEYCRENGIPKGTEIARLRASVNPDTLTQQELIHFLRGFDSTDGKDLTRVSFTKSKLDKYFPHDMSLRERERLIISLLEQWKEENGGN